MVGAIVNFFENSQTWILAFTTSGWILPILFVFAVIDGVFPPIPSESLLVALAVAAMATGRPNIFVVLLIGAAGAWAGNQVAFGLGRALGTSRLAVLRTPRGRRAVAWAERSLARRGAAYILAAQFIPVGRVAVNVTAGAVGYARRRYLTLTAIAATMWAGYTMAIGVAAEQWLGGSPLAAMAVGVVVGIAAGFGLDRVLGAWERHRLSAERRTPKPGRPAEQRALVTPTAPVTSTVPRAGLEPATERL